MSFLLLGLLFDDNFIQFVLQAMRGGFQLWADSACVFEKNAVGDGGMFRITFIWD